MDLSEALLAFKLHMEEMRDKVEHPRPLYFESRTYVYEPELKIRLDEVTLTYTISKKRAPKEARKEDKSHGTHLRKGGHDSETEDRQPSSTEGGGRD